MITLPELFSQRDERWRNEKLGTSLLTLGTSGCLITCIAVLARLFGKDTNPSKLNKDLIERGGFKNGTDYTFYGKDITQPLGISLVYPDIKITRYTETPSAVTSKQFAEIKAQIDRGYPVLIQVDFLPATTKLDQHWVLIINYENDNYYVYDPYYGDIANLTRYGTPSKTIYKFVYYEGNVPTPEPQTDWAAKYNVIKEEFEQYKSKTEPYKTLVEKIATRLNAAPSESEIMGAVNEYEHCEEIESKLWYKAKAITGKDFIKPDEIESLLKELDIVGNDAKSWRERKPDVIAQPIEETPKEEVIDERLTLTKRIIAYILQLFSRK